jgi:hypothetical protein
MRIRSWALPILCAAVSCGGAQGQAEAPDSSPAAGEEQARVRQVPPGECKEAAVADGVKQVTASNAGWSYIVPDDAVVQCSEAKAVLAMGAGLNVVVTSVAPPEEGGTVPESLVSLMVQKATEGVQAQQENVEIQEPSAGTFGEARYPGYCGGARFDVDGQRLRSVVCSASSTDGDGVVHIFLAGITDTEEGFAAAGGNDAALFSQLIDGWKPPAAAP